MKDLEKQFEPQDIESAKAWVRNECGPMSEEGFAKAVKQVLELRRAPRVIELKGGVPLNMHTPPADYKPFPEEVLNQVPKRYNEKQVTEAKAYISENFDTRTLSGGDYDKLLGQVLQVLNPTGRPWDVSELNADIFAKPVQHSYVTGELLQRAEEEPLLNLDNVRRMPEMQKPAPTFEDKVTNRLMLALARGEIKLELDGTPEGKARDAKVVKEYLTRNAGYYPYETRDQWLQETGGISVNPRGGVDYEYPDSDGIWMLDINPPRPTDAHANGLLEKVQLGRNPELRTDRLVLVTPINNKDE